ncbi:MAG: hypothetical protein ACYDGR_01080 [Candidatus Dormibacteria bacterium]
MLEIVLRGMAVFILSLILVGFGWYFSFGTDTLQHDWIYFGGGVLSLLAGIATFVGGMGSLVGQAREWGLKGVTSDVGEGYDSAPAARGGAAAAAAASDEE